MRPILRRTARLIITLVLVTFLTSLMLDLLPGDPAVAIAGGDTFNVTPERIQQVREDLNLDDSVFVRYAKWLGNALTGDFGTSYRTREPVTNLIKPRLAVTLEVTILAQVLALLFALILAPIAALKPGAPFDRGVSGLTFGLVSTPTFVSGLVLIQIFAVQLGWLPSTGFSPIGDGLVDNLKSVAMPALALAAAETGVYTRVLRSEIIATMREDFMLMARAKGLSLRYLMTRHALRPSSLPLLTLIGLSIGALIGGSVIIEPLFALPGIGRLMVDSISNRDLVAVQALVAMVSVTFVLANYLIDIAYVVADPRIRSG